MVWLLVARGYRLVNVGAIPSRAQYRFVRIAIMITNGRNTEGRVAPLVQGNPAFRPLSRKQGRNPSWPFGHRCSPDPRTPPPESVLRSFRSCAARTTIEGAGGPLASRREDRRDSPDANLVRIVLGNIRRKLGDASSPEFIFSERGVGYRMAGSGGTQSGSDAERT